MVRFLGPRVILDAERKVVARLLVGRTVLGNWLSVFRYSLDTIHECGYSCFSIEARSKPGEKQKGPRPGRSPIPISAEFLLCAAATSSLRQASQPLADRASAPAPPAFAKCRPCRPSTRGHLPPIPS